MSLRRRLVSLSATCLAAALSAATLAAPAAAAPPQHLPRTYYLALGDSLGYGYQNALITEQVAAGEIQPNAFPGYAVPFSAELADATGQQVELVNLSCPGETTTSFRESCGFSGAYGRKALHDPYKGSQLDAALKFLRAHGKHTSVISLSLGSNDLNAALHACQAAAMDLPADEQLAAIAGCLVPQVPRLAAAVSGELARTVAALKQAAPHADVAVFTIYNPSALPLQGSNALLVPINQVIAAAVAGQGALVADGFSAINGSGDTASCFVLTPFCTNGDIHPTDVGYAALTQALVDAYETQ